MLVSRRRYQCDITLVSLSFAVHFGALFYEGSKNMKTSSQESTVQVPSGWPILATALGTLLIAVGSLVGFIVIMASEPPIVQFLHFIPLIAFIVLLLAGIFLCCGFFTLQPNEARVLTLFGKYVGTERRSGFHWTNPFNEKPRISLRSRNFNSATLKVNDKNGNPIEIGVVVVWKVEDTAQAKFDVDNFVEFVKVQSESAVRVLASRYSYDQGEEDEITLRSGVEEVSMTLKTELQDRLEQAGVVVEEARLSHLAYAPEIAGAMLRRQQAEAVIAARTKIVHGAVSMVEMALGELSARKVVELDSERKASMVSNLLVVLCSETDAQPVLNTGTLYS